MFTLYWLRIETSNALENQSILSFTKAALERLLSEEECIESAPYKTQFKSEIYLIEWWSILYF